MVIRVAVALAALVATARAGEPPALDQAKQLVDQVRYDEAQRVLISALEAGGNTPASMREIYKLLGASAVALGKVDDAEKYYRAWIALEPSAALEAGASPKLRAPFDAAKSFVAANGPLDVAAEYVSDDDVRVRVISDPLALARTAQAGTATIAIVDRAALVTGARRGPIAVRDRYGNTLVEVTATDAPPAPREPVPPSEPVAAPVTVTAPSPAPVIRTREGRSTTFYALAIPTAVLLATGVGFGITSIAYHGRVTSALEDSGSSYYGDVVDDQKKVALFWKLSAIAGAAGLALAVPTTIVYLRSRDAMVAPYVDGDGGGMTLAGRF